MALIAAGDIFQHTCRKRREGAASERTGAGENGSWQSGLDDDTQAMSHMRRSKQMLEETVQTGAALLINVSDGSEP